MLSAVREVQLVLCDRCTESRKEAVLEEGNSNELRRAEPLGQADTPMEDNPSFDELAMGFADGTLTRGRVLKLMGVALLGGLGTFMGISTVAVDPADAKRRRKKKRKHNAVVLTPVSPV